MGTELQVTRLAGSLGAEVRGLSVANAGPDDIARVRELLREHLVLFFPDQRPSIDEHVAFGRHFGPLEAHPNLKNPITDHPEIFELVASRGGIADEWHSDITFQPNPSVYAILHMVRCPTVGGDTMWANMYQAYEALSAPMRELCDGLSALHDAAPHGRPDITAIHPVVRMHPETGRRSLFVNEHFTRRIVEMSHEESANLLGYLTRWVSSPRFTVRRRWQQGTIAMWDNRCTQHYVLNDFDQERIIQRVTVMGDEPRGIAAPRWQPFTRIENAAATSRYDRQLNAHLGREATTLESNSRTPKAAA
ncbi:MAG: TauD/TfdA family dioxygenase [Burkholderiaceae bacterium]|nr:TauD/TfdA family dioxygenase [Burkholderiaceae bacterium]